MASPDAALNSVSWLQIFNQFPARKFLLLHSVPSVHFYVVVTVVWCGEADRTCVLFHFMTFRPL